MSVGRLKQPLSFHDLFSQGRSVKYTRELWRGYMRILFVSPAVDLALLNQRQELFQLCFVATIVLRVILLKRIDYRQRIIALFDSLDLLNQGIQVVVIDDKIR